MLHATRWGLLLGVLGFTLTGSLRSEDDLKSRVKQLRHDAAIQAGQGNVQAAEELEREAKMLLEKAEHSKQRAQKPEPEVRHVKEQLHDLLQQEKKLIESQAPEEALERVRNQIREAKTVLEQVAHSESNPKHQLELAARRVQHLRVAAENLKLAGAHDLAQEVMKQAEMQEREIGDAKRRLAEQGGRDRKEHDAPQVQELRAEVERLRAELQELRKAIQESK